LSGKPSTFEKELAYVEKCIIRTMRKFRETPRSFWSEDDIRCYLKSLLQKSRLFRSGRVSNVFLSFPTRNTYHRAEDGAISPSATGDNARFSIAGWSSSIPNTSNHLTQPLTFAIELKYFSVMPEDWLIRIRNDLFKLSDEANQVPLKGRFFLLLTAQQISLLRRELNALLAQFPSVKCYQQLAQ
jgi:hypothetical protein